MSCSLASLAVLAAVARHVLSHRKKSVQRVLEHLIEIDWASPYKPYDIQLLSARARNTNLAFVCRRYKRLRLHARDPSESPSISKPTGLDLYCILVERSAEKGESSSELSLDVDSGSVCAIPLNLQKVNAYFQFEIQLRYNRPFPLASYQTLCSRPLLRLLHSLAYHFCSKRLVSYCSPVHAVRPT